MDLLNEQKTRLDAARIKAKRLYIQLNIAMEKPL
jgi:hypothetical protein